VDPQRKHLKAWTHFSGSKHEYSRWLNKLVKYLRLPIPFPDFLGSEDSVQLSRGVLETMAIPHSIPMDLAVPRPHDVFEQLPIPADLFLCALFSPPGSEFRAFNFCGFGGR
jgi:hypothetical protein